MDQIPVDDILRDIGFENPVRAEVVTGGADALLWRLRDADKSFALRLLRQDQQTQAQREISLSNWVNTHAPNLSVPQIIRSGTWNDRPAYVMDWIEGRTLGDAAMDQSLDPEILIKLARAFGERQAQIHHMPVPTDIESFADSWLKKVTDPLLIERIGAVQTHHQALLHLDYHPLNVMVNGSEIVAVLDWANAAVGDPRFDLARTQAIIELAPVLPNTDTAFLTSLLEYWKSGYERVAGPVVIDPVFYWWAGALIERELTPRVGNPAIPWLNQAFIERVRTWTAAFRA